jgi:hypothetical protein
MRKELTPEERERRLAYYREYYYAHRELKRAQHKASEDLNDEERRAYREANKERIRITNQRWWSEHPEKRREYAAKWRAENRELSRARDRERYARVRRAMIAAYGGCCACCGETELAFLTLDHTNGDGAAHRREVSSGDARHAQRWSQKKIIKQLYLAGWPNDDGRFRILCFNCQFGVMRPGGCPHQTSCSELA